MAAGVAVYAGDPVCSEVNMPLLITEFITHCKQNDLETYNLAGGKGAKIRNAINHACALGITVSEYKPLEKITKEAFDKMKSEGVKWGALGLAPLVNAAYDGGVFGRLFEFVYEKLNSFYGLKGLYHYKEKYGPTVLENRYIVYYPKLFTPKIAYSIVKAQNPKGVGDFILIQLKSFFRVKREEV